MATSITDLTTEHTDPSGDNDLLVIDDYNGGSPVTKKVAAKNATGGMLAHGGLSSNPSGASVEAIYSLWDSNGAEEYQKIATLQYSPTVDAGEYVELDIYYGGIYFNEKGGMKIGLSNRGGVLNRVYSIYGKTNKINRVGIKTYIETDNTVSVYMYHAASPGAHLTVKLSTSAYNHGAIVISPNDVTSITTPTGTLSLDTTAAPYSDGVPDGNEDWTNLTLAASYTGACRYRRHANGLVEVNANLSALGTTTDGTSIITGNLPAGYRPVSYNRHAILTGRISGGACGTIIINTSGSILIYDYASSSATWQFNICFMAEA